MLTKLSPYLFYSLLSSKISEVEGRRMGDKETGQWILKQTFLVCGSNLMSRAEMIKRKMS